MGKFIGVVVGLLAIAALVYYAVAGSGPAPPAVTFAPVARQTLVSTIVTNGRIEPASFATIRAPREGALTRFTLRKGDRVAAGQEIARLADPAGALEADTVAAESRLAQARSELAVLDQGAPPAALAEIDGNLAAAKLDLETARREAARTARLVEKKAETAESLTAAQDRVRSLESQIASLERRRAALSPPSSARDAAAARIRDAEAALALVRRRAEQSSVRSPAAGVVFNLAVRPDAFVRPGDALADIARSGGGVAKAIVYVDEPELGRVARGMKVRITWDAATDRAWDAEVDQLPTQIVPLNSRQIGEVVCLLTDPGQTLPPGANINAEIRSREVTGALSIPKAALRREGAVTGVFVLGPESRLAWRPVQVGVSSLTHAEITTGLADSDRVALPADVPLTPGQLVTAK